MVLAAASTSWRAPPCNRGSDPELVRRAGRAMQAPGTSLAVLRRALAGSPSGKATLLVDGDVLLLDLLLDGDVLLLYLLLDGDVLLLDGDVLLASVRICLRGCSSVRRKISWKYPSGIRVQ